MLKTVYAPSTIFSCWVEPQGTRTPGPHGHKELSKSRIGSRGLCFLIFQDLVKFFMRTVCCFLLFKLGEKNTGNTSFEIAKGCFLVKIKFNGINFIVKNIYIYKIIIVESPVLFSS